METEIERRLQRSSKKQLVFLIQELTAQHPELSAEIDSTLERLASATEDEYSKLSDDADEQQENEWDTSEELATMDFVRVPEFPPVDLVAYRERFEGYLLRIKQKKSLQPICDDLFAILKEAQQRADREDYYNALDLYALVLDERLAERNATLTSILDKAINEIMPMLQAVLINVCSCIIVTSSSFLTPVLTPEMRKNWLERLFAFWLKRLDRYHVEEDVPEILMEMAWENDLGLLRTIVQEELQRLRQNGTSNIVNFTRQYRTRALEKFLKELPLA
ncbi:hypothetical protein KSF_032880 [Reticulibacter mediterranei]|uniref:Uncharacterized protein n=1 Tax=Reticulibacter mediterranei TaxID=2778369 RepID=A0A8J3IMB6_9CHLR|nr:hypothetical protein [Reticulibacter mediterranei]GHO93240.1 hypothetical protein KSF_032880 [Reticulibacter mediterranei]